MRGPNLRDTNIIRTSKEKYACINRLRGFIDSWKSIYIVIANNLSSHLPRRLSINSGLCYRHYSALLYWKPNNTMQMIYTLTIVHYRKPVCKRINLKQIVLSHRYNVRAGGYNPT